MSETQRPEPLGPFNPQIATTHPATRDAKANLFSKGPGAKFGKTGSLSVSKTPVGLGGVQTATAEGLASINEFEVIRQVAAQISMVNYSQKEQQPLQNTQKINLFDGKSETASVQSKTHQRLKSAQNFNRLFYGSIDDRQRYQGSAIEVQSSTTKVSTMSGFNRLIQGTNMNSSEKLKVCMRIWSGFTKFLRSQCNKGRVIDSLCFGTFFRDQPLSEADAKYVLVAEDKTLLGEFIVSQSPETIVEIPLDIANSREFTSINLSAIAQVCGCTTENVNQFLSKLREVITSLCFSKKKQVCLNMPIGQLLFYPSLTAEFKSNNTAAAQSLYGDLNSSIMKNGPEDNKAGHNLSQPSFDKGDKGKNAKTRMQQKKAKQSIDEGYNSERKDLTHLSDFLRTQIINRQLDRKSQKSHGSKCHTVQTQDSRVKQSLKYNNALIERASRDVKERRKLNQNKTATASTSKMEVLKSKEDGLSAVESKLTQASRFDLSKTQDRQNETQSIQSQKHFRKNILSPRSYLRSAQQHGAHHGGSQKDLESQSPYTELRKQADLISEANFQKGPIQTTHQEKSRQGSQLEKMQASKSNFLVSQGAATYSHDLNKLNGFKPALFYSNELPPADNKSIYQERTSRVSRIQKVQRIDLNNLSKHREQLEQQGPDLSSAFQEQQFVETGKKGIQYIEPDKLKSLIHHGAHSQSLQQMLIQKKNNFHNARNLNSIKNLQNVYNSQEGLLSNHHVLTGTSSEASAQEKKQLISSALNRHEISNGYHSTAYPYFMKSNGPFKIYDHATHKGKMYEANLSYINDLAKSRFKQELSGIKQGREFEKEQFKQTKLKQDLLAEHQQYLCKGRNLQNKEVIEMQIQSARQRKEDNHLREKRYYKPHFGPEETDELIELEKKRKDLQKQYVNEQLQMQMQIKNNEQEKAHYEERVRDLQNLKKAFKVYVNEERALQDKARNEREDLRKEWEEQIEERSKRKKMENIFR